MKKMLIVLLGTFAMVGCYVTVKDGKVPEENREQALAYTGTYYGQFEGKKVDLTLSIDNDGVAKLIARDAKGNSQLIGGCKSTIGALEQVEVSSKTKDLRQAMFDLDPGNCDIAGRQVIIAFESAQKINVSVVATTRQRHVPGDVDCTEPLDHSNSVIIDQTIQRCHHTPGYFETVPDKYLTGSFSR